LVSPIFRFIPIDAFEQTAAAFVKPMKIPSCVVPLVEIAHRLHEMRRRKRCIAAAGLLPQGSMGGVRVVARRGPAKTGPEDLLKFP
jgi:hypothetical protein